MTDAPGSGDAGSGAGAQLDDLSRENAALRQRLAALEAERNAIGQRLASTETENRQWVERYVWSEQQRSDLSHLYAATHTLSAPTSRAEVVEAIRQVVANLIGVEDMAFFDTAAGSATLALVASFGDTTPPRSVRVGDGLIGEAARRGSHCIAGRTDAVAAQGEPDVVACIPLKARGAVVGVIVLFQLLPQKGELVALDERLFEILSTHGGIAWDATAGPSASADPRGAV